MRRTVYYCAMTLDGYIAESDDTLGWLFGYDGTYESPGARSSAGMSGYDEFYETIGSIVMGSATYEFILNHSGDWAYEGKPTWVLTSRSLPVPERADVRFHDGDVEAIHDELLAAAGDRDAWVMGGGNVASQYADAGLLDEVWVTTVPVVLGSGKPLFDRGLPGGPMQLVDTYPFDNGMVALRYAVQRVMTDP